MEFPHLGEHCAQSDCKKLGKLIQKFAAIFKINLKACKLF